ncbi:hypothetical protein HJFPF1_00087 [Paramyrothecium foliicola]|nr:hypothetical protein HJFPF1_00087 [Paramyrothecium foliicola]
MYGGLDWFAIYRSLSYDICRDLEVEINPDIFGAGDQVAVSYTMQIVITLFAWLAIRFIGARATVDSFASPFGFLRKERESFTDRHPSVSSVLIRMEQTNLAHATKTFVSEFQEAQCFFVIAVQIALLYANPLPADANGSNNWQSLVSNRQTSETIAIQAALLLIVVQISLSQAQLGSYYSFLLVFVAEVLVDAAWRTATNPDFDQVTLFLFGCEVLLLTFLGLQLYDKAHPDISSTLSYTTGNHWNVGQVIAVLVWAPVISRYLHLITGMSVFA